MDSLKGKTFVITGATGRQGSAFVRHLWKEGACVKALTRDPNSEKAKQLMALGAELVTGNVANSKVIIPGCAHLPNMERLAEFNEIVEGFLHRAARDQSRVHLPEAEGQRPSRLS